eukprot:CAMPEP_0178419036 /NCGR_PEP_ID=MMETSP0689_2-20121128/25398_1 /TAXON_ID=160604 /ORGANISM="Amphidinium massartii, Strain CS-259" /LENGTH=191 /DNA_ID=CAMNT_0020040451 /DNA_START=111 /DNA_END=682 /DNA_ORIENTATION=-
MNLSRMRNWERKLLSLMIAQCDQSLQLVTRQFCESISASVASTLPVATGIISVGSSVVVFKEYGAARPEVVAHGQGVVVELVLGVLTVLVKKLPALMFKAEAGSAAGGGAGAGAKVVVALVVVVCWSHGSCPEFCDSTSPKLCSRELIKRRPKKTPSICSPAGTLSQLEGEQGQMGFLASELYRFGIGGVG